MPAKGRLPTELAAVLEHEIRQRRYEPGQRLPTEAALSARFSVSRAAVREAIAHLRSSGLIHTRQGAGSFVASPLAWRTDSTTDQSPRHVTALRQTFEVRQELEPGAAAMAARNRDSAAIRTLETAFSGLSRAFQSGAPAGEADAAFHQAIASATGNPVFVELIGYFHASMLQSIVLARSNTARRGYPGSTTHAEHQAILEAITDGDPDAARAAMHLHIANARRRLGLAPIRSCTGHPPHQSSAP